MPAEFFLAHIWLIPMFPLITAAAMLFLGRKLAQTVINALCVGSVFISFIFSAGSFLQLLSLPQDNRIAIKPLLNVVEGPVSHGLDHADDGASNRLRNYSRGSDAAGCAWMGSAGVPAKCSDFA